MLIHAHLFKGNSFRRVKATYFNLAIRLFGLFTI